MQAPHKSIHPVYRLAVLFLSIAILMSMLDALSARTASANPIPQYTIQFLSQYFDTNLVNASKVSGSTNSRELFDINNSSRLWYRIEFTNQAAQVTVRDTGDMFDTAAMRFGLIAPPTDTPFDCHCLLATHTVPLQATFSGPNQVDRFTVDPFDRLAASFDVADLALEIVSSGDKIPLSGLAGNIQEVISELQSLPDFEDSVTAFISFLHSAGRRDASSAQEFMRQVAEHLLNIFRKSNLARILARALDNAAGAVFDLTTAAGAPIDIFSKTLEALNGAVNWLQSKIQALGAAYNVLATVVDEALAMGALLGYQYAPTVDIRTVGLAPSSGASKVATPTARSSGGTTSPGTNSPSGGTSNSAWVSNSPAITVQPRQQFSVQFTFKNTGTATWSDGDGYALRCDTYYHSGGTSSCMGGSLVGFGSETVASGQQHTFQFTLTAPSSPGTYQTWWDMTRYGSIFGSNNAYVQVTVQQPNVAPVDNDQWVANSAYLTVNPGQVFSIYFTFQNTGNTTWSDAGGYELGCDTYYTPDSNCMGAGPVGLNGETVAPGQQHQFWVTLTAPLSAGVYTAAWDMRHNGGIFGANHVYVQVTVPQPVDNDQWSGNSPYLTVSPGQVFSIYFSFTNTGNTTWSDVEGYQLACDTYYNPTSACMGGGSVGFNGQTVAPGQQYQFWVTLTAPSTAGVYDTAWDMRHNGSIFGANHVFVQVTVP